MIKKKNILFLFIPLLFFISGFSLLQNSNDIETIYLSRSDVEIHSYFKNWQKRSALYRESNKRELGKTEKRIELLLKAFMNNVEQKFDHSRFHLVDDSLNITFYKKWAEYPQVTRRFPSSEFSVWNDTATLFLFHDYDSSIVAFLDADKEANSAYVQNDSLIPPRVAFVNKYFPAHADTWRKTYDVYYYQLENWRKKINYNSTFIWIIESEPFIENIYMKKNLQEAYVFMNRFSSTKYLYFKFKSGNWIIAENEKNKSDTK